MNVKKWENNGTEEIGLVTPTPGVSQAISLNHIVISDNKMIYPIYFIMA